jgi:uncharacterized membrane protein YdbT with pleckstrin-like domain
MSTVDHYLADDEDLIYVTRQHWTQLVGEFVVLLVIWAVAAGLVWVVPSGQSWGRDAIYAVLGVAVVLSVWFWLVPLLKWRGIIYILSTRRIHQRSGFLTKSGRSIPLTRVNDISFEASLWERIIRCGTLKIESGSEQGLMTLRHVPDPEDFKTKIYEAMDEVQDHHDEDDEPVHQRHQH